MEIELRNKQSRRRVSRCFEKFVSLSFLKLTTKVIRDVGILLEHFGVCVENVLLYFLLASSDVLKST